MDPWPYPLDHSAGAFADRPVSATRPLRLKVVNCDAHAGIADQRPVWSCAEQNPFSECREDSWCRGKSEELLRVLRSRMAISAASIADARVASAEI
jgi:hypothetical protein